MKNQVPVREKDVQKAVMDLLAAERIWAMRINTVAIRTAKGRPIFSHTAGPGVADILATPITCSMISSPILLWIECKSSDGKQRQEQAEFQKQVEEQGHHYIIARSSDDVLRWLKEHR